MNNGDTPAFSIVTPDNAHFFGLTKREYFAGMAMQAMIARSAVPMRFEEAAITSLAYADELLRVLNEEKPEGKDQK